MSKRTFIFNTQTVLHYLPDQRLRMGDEVVVTIGGKAFLHGTVETRHPNLPRRLTIRYAAENGTTGVTRAWGTLPGPAEYVGTKYETKVLRVVSRSILGS